MIEPGTQAPAFTLPRDGGGEVSLADLAGKTVILFFYPKDDTPGCTKEAIAFSGLLTEFEAANAVILGVSKDTVKKHEKFRDKHELTVTLLSDDEGDVCERYGVWVEKSMYGKTYMGIERSTFLIDGTGIVREAWHKVKVPGHAEQVLEAVQAL